MISPDAIDDQFFGSEVGVSNKIQFTLISYAHRAPEPFGQQASRIARSLNGKVKQTNPFHFRQSYRAPVLLSGYIRTWQAANRRDLWCLILSNADCWFARSAGSVPAEAAPFGFPSGLRYKSKLRATLNCLGPETRYSRLISKPNGLRLVTKQLERVPAFGPSTRRTIARLDESASTPTRSTTTLCPSGVTKN